ncbi:MAG: TIGR01212 family radical SAM protein, partial [Cytophagales bacterium]|nr:TIGR01212 family radical SAM protein [Cytophagales bacterium]
MEFNNGKRYNDYSSFIKKTFEQRVQKISLNTGFGCPNRDGTKGVGGCTYCNNNTFNPDYCRPSVSITQQLEEGIAMFSKKYSSIKYLAYFQAYTNTYADFKLIKELYTEAVNHPDVLGLVIGTRPDCINEEIIDFLSDLSKKHFISLEFGVESTLNRTLETINRCHTYEETLAAYDLAKNKGLHLGAHIILGLPGESRAEMLNHASELSKLPIDTLKIHQLQVVKHTMMALDFEKSPEKFQLFDVDDYIDFITEFVAHLRPEILIDRFISQSPFHLLIGPKWGLKNYEIAPKIEAKLAEKNLWQGKEYDVNPVIACRK